ncbi:hypothetical protein ACQP2T_28015 [Nonomuraea sp. CA-143628]|uniref:hypothetical protein n=1 Tax=Nonomuraea sp. CA-143628 TaxID=3239997 RepID=UPI003D8E172B
MAHPHSEVPPLSARAAQGLARVHGNGSVERMLELAGKLGLTEADIAHMPHQIAAEIAEGLLWYEDHNRLSHARDWHSIYRAEADIAATTGLEGIVAYLLHTFWWEETVEKILRRSQRTAGVSPEEMARRMRLKLGADATFGFRTDGPATTGL